MSRGGAERLIQELAGSRAAAQRAASQLGVHQRSHGAICVDDVAYFNSL